MYDNYSVLSPNINNENIIIIYGVLKGNVHQINEERQLICKDEWELCTV